MRVREEWGEGEGEIKGEVKGEDRELKSKSMSKLTVSL